MDPKRGRHRLPLYLSSKHRGMVSKRVLGELNKVWCGLGQIFRDRKAANVFLDFAFLKAEDPLYDCTIEEYNRLVTISRQYGIAS